MAALVPLFSPGRRLPRQELRSPGIDLLTAMPRSMGQERVQMRDSRSRGGDDPSEKIRHEMHAAIRRAAEPSAPGESVKAAIRRASLRLGLTFGRARKIWYGEARRIDAFEADAVRLRLRGLAIEEIERLRSRLERLDREVADATADRGISAPAGDRSDGVEAAPRRPGGAIGGLARNRA